MEANRIKLSSKVRIAMTEKVREALDAQPLAVERAISILFERQTAAEKATETTIVHNNVGVKHCHGRRIAYYGKWLASGRHLTGHHLDFARRIAHSYAGTQLAELAAVKAGLAT